MTPKDYRKVTASDIGFAADQKLLDLPRSGSAFLMRDYRKIPPSEINSIMAMYAELFARAKCLRRKYQILYSLLRGIVGLPQRILVALKKYGMAAKLSHGRSLVGQIGDMCKVWWQTGLLPVDYYDGQLAQYSGSNTLVNYLPWATIANVVAELQFSHFGPLSLALNDKAKIEEWCRENEIPCIGGMALYPDAPAPDIEAINSIGESLFVKTRSDMAGANAEAWRQGSDGRWSGQDRNLSSGELCNWFAERAGREVNGIIIQERLKNHPDMEEMCGSVLSTCRIVTVLNEKREPEVVESHWRMATNPDAIVDNFHCGGLAWDIHDYEIGEIAFGLWNDSKNKQVKTLFHPIADKRMAGSCHPYWSQMRDLVLDSHRRMDGIWYVGWDIAVTPKGLTVVEMNFPSALNPNVQMKWDGIKNSRLGEILAWRAERWLRENVETTSRRQIGSHYQVGT